jgi:hypothetical protein
LAILDSVLNKNCNTLGRDDNKIPIIEISKSLITVTVLDNVIQAFLKREHNSFYVTVISSQIA